MKEVDKKNTIENIVKATESLTTDFLSIMQLIGHYKNIDQMKKPLSVHWDDLVTAYIREFEKKEDCELEFVDRERWHFLVADLPLTFSDLKYSIDKKMVPEKIFDYLDMSFELYQEGITPPNIKNWNKNKWTFEEYKKMAKKAGKGV